MEENIYMLSDAEIYRRIGAKVHYLRLRQNYTQASLSEHAQISVSTLKKIEKGDISSFDSLIRVLRILGQLDSLTSLVKEEEMSPNEYYAFIQATQKKRRKRASNTKHNTVIHQPDNDSKW